MDSEKPSLTGMGVLGKEGKARLGWQVGAGMSMKRRVGGGQIRDLGLTVYFQEPCGFPKRQIKMVLPLARKHLPEPGRVLRKLRPRQASLCF